MLLTGPPTHVIMVKPTEGNEMKEYEIGEMVEVKIPHEKDGWAQGKITGFTPKRIKAINYGRTGTPQCYKPSNVRKVG